MDFRKLIRDVPDFPKTGIVFKDITTLTRDPEGFRASVDAIAGRYADSGVDAVVGVEARGFIFGAAVAYRMGVGFVPARKPGKLPAETVKAEYELEYGTDAIEMHRDAIEPGQRVLIVDDLLATGGTAAAAAKLVEELRGEVVAIAFVVDLAFLKGRDKLAGHDVFCLIEYGEE
ncbi:MAG: adenine phosphoribosyltransferase [Candidatus Eisenbacteria bacterium]|nr:adenine phosphoribosyltransferase [Candidatus Eisenbacteria bacterium]